MERNRWEKGGDERKVWKGRGKDRMGKGGEEGMFYEQYKKVMHYENQEWQFYILHKLQCSI